MCLVKIYILLVNVHSVNYTSLFIDKDDDVSDESLELSDDDVKDDGAAEIPSDDSWHSEDDPEKLWCICRKPYEKRFMICCDNCVEWFHGSCVNVTRQQGKNIEASKSRWICPKCRGIY